MSSENFPSQKDDEDCACRQPVRRFSCLNFLFHELMNADEKKETCRQRNDPSQERVSFVIPTTTKS